MTEDSPPDDGDDEAEAEPLGATFDDLDPAEGDADAEDDGSAPGDGSTAGGDGEPTPGDEPRAGEDRAAVEGDEDRESTATGTVDDGGAAEPDHHRDRSRVRTAYAMDPKEWGRKLRHRFRTSRTLQVVTAITVLALFARLLLLGQRAAHWDEGRVAYWVLRYQQTGVWEYRPIVHGPFFFHVDKYLFTIFGPSDFVARLPVAVVGGLLPALGWLLRDHLRDTEVVALAGLLALNPLLFYYSRFMRNDVLVAGFVLFAVGFFARAYVTRRPAYLYAGTLSFALAFTTKENAVLYLACLLGALGLLLDHRLIGAVRRNGITGDAIRDWLVEGDSLRLVAVGVIAAFNPIVVAAIPFLSPSAPTWALVLVTGIAVAASSAILALDATPYHFLGAVVMLPTVGLAAFLGGEQALLLFALAWVLVAMLALDEYLFLAPVSPDADEEQWETVADGGDQPEAFRQVPPMLVAYVLLFGTLIFFFAPRGGAVDGLGLWQSLLNPTQIPALVEEALLGSWQKLYAVWIDSPSELELYRGRVENLLRTLKTTAGVLTVFAAVGFVVDRWGADGPRDVVSLAGYWGIVSVLGYPYATDIWAPWVGVHVVAPLAIPAAVGLGLVLRWGVEATHDEDPFGVGVVAVLLLVLALPVGITVVDVGYLGSDTHERVIADDDERNQYVLQWAQPGNDMKGSLATAGAIARANDDGPDVLFYGTNNPVSGEMLFHVQDDEVCAAQPPIHEPFDTCQGSNWHSRLPLPWYMELYDANTTSTAPGEGLDRIREDPPPVIIAYSWNRTEIDRELPGRYEVSEHRFKLWEENIVIFVDTEAVPDSER